MHWDKQKQGHAQNTCADAWCATILATLEWSWFATPPGSWRSKKQWWGFAIPGWGFGRRCSIHPCWIKISSCYDQLRSLQSEKIPGCKCNIIYVFFQDAGVLMFPQVFLPQKLNDKILIPRHCGHWLVMMRFGSLAFSAVCTSTWTFFGAAHTGSDF